MKYIPHRKAFVNKNIFFQDITASFAAIVVLLTSVSTGVYSAVMTGGAHLNNPNDLRDKRTALTLLALLVCALGVSFEILVFVPSSRYSIIDHPFRVNPFVLILLTGVLFVALSAAWRVQAGAEARYFQREPKQTRSDGLLSFLPLTFFLAAPFLLGHYLTCGDLRTRLLLLCGFVVLAMVYLKLTQWTGYGWTRPALAEKIRTRLVALSRRKKLVLLFIVAFVIYNACSWILVSQDVAFTGDEPTYLLTTMSLARDGDINIFNNFEQRDFVYFYEMEKNPLMRFELHAQRSRKGQEYAYPVNMPGISFLMLPFYGLSQLFKGKALIFILRSSLSLWAVLLGLQLYLLALELWGKRRTAFRLWGLYSFTAPVLFYAVHIYPEVLIALFSIYVYRKVISRTPIRFGQAILCGFLLALFPWFGLKYMWYLWPLVIVAAYYLLKYHKAGWKILFVAGLPVVSQALFAYFTYALYGTFSPASIYEGVMTPEQTRAIAQAILSVPLHFRTGSFLGYFLDQRDGILLYSPIYLFSFMGLIEFFRRRKKDLLALLLVVLPYIASHAFMTLRPGFAPQARGLVPVSWAGALLLGYFLEHNKNWLFSFLFKAACLWSFLCAGLLLFHPMFLYQPTTGGVATRPGDFFVFLSNLHFFLPPLLPSFLKIPNAGYIPNYVWVLAVVFIIIAYVMFPPRREAPRAFRPIVTFVVLAGCVFLWAYYPRSVLYPSYTVDYSSRQALGYYLFPMGKGVVPKPGGQLYLHLEKPYKILFNSRLKLDKLKIVFGSEKGEHEVSIRFFDLAVFSGKTSYERKEVEFSPAAYYPYRNFYLYEVNVELKKLSKENMLIDPFYFYIIPSSQ